MKIQPINEVIGENAPESRSTEAGTEQRIELLTIRPRNKMVVPADVAIGSFLMSFLLSLLLAFVLIEYLAASEADGSSEMNEWHPRIQPLPENITIEDLPWSYWEKNDWNWRCFSGTASIILRIV